MNAFFVMKFLLYFLLVCGLSPVSAAPRSVALTAVRATGAGAAVTHFRGNPLDLVVTLDATRPTLTGVESLNVEIRSSVTDTATPLARTTLEAPEGAGPFSLSLSGAQLNQSLGGLEKAAFWQVVYTLADGGETVDVLYTGPLVLREHGASLTAGAAPNVVGALTRSAADALYATLGDTSVLPLSRIPLHNAGVYNPIVRIKDPSAFQVTLAPTETLNIRTSNQPDGSAATTTSAVVHPSVIRFMAPWHGYEWWMVITPYPGGDASYENPSLMVSHNGCDWIEHPGVVNPLAPYPLLSTSQGDNHLSYDPEEDRLIVVYLRKSTTAMETRMIQSDDGATWTAPVVISTHATVAKGSPNLVRFINAGGVVKWRLYYHRMGTDGGVYRSYREALLPFGVAGSWDAAAEVTTVSTGLPAGRSLWDFQMYNLPGGQWMDITAVSYGEASAATVLCMGISDDGVNFTYGRPLLRRAKTGTFPDFQVYTTSFVPSLSGDVAFRAFTTGVTAGVGWGLMVSDVTLRSAELPSGTQKLFEFNHRYNISPASGAVTAVSAMTPEGVAAVTTNAGATKATRGSSGLTFNGTDQYLHWDDKAWAKPAQWTAVCRFQPLGNPATASGVQTVFLIWDLAVVVRPVLGVWQLQIRNLGESSVFVPQLLVPYAQPVTIAVSWDGTTARFGSSLSHDYGGPQTAALTSITNNGDIWIAGGLNSGTPGGVRVEKLMLFDRAATEDLEGMALSYDP